MRGVGVLRKQTKQFIAENATSVILMRTTMIDDGAGGEVPASADPTPLDPQDMRIVIKAPNQQVEVRTVGGEVVRPEYSILAEYDADLKAGDSFTHDGTRIEVVFVYSIGDYEKRAEAVRRG